MRTAAPPASGMLATELESLPSLTDWLLAQFERYRPLPDKVSQCFAALTQTTITPDALPLIAAGKALAHDIDLGIGQADQNAYHNRQHFCEVMLSTHCLAILCKVGVTEHAELLYAALAHDVFHDGSKPSPGSFRLERLAVEQATPYLARAGVCDEQIKKISTLILATQIPDALHFVREAHAQHTLHHEYRQPPPAQATEMLALATDTSLCMQALILGEADLLPSTGLSLDHAMHLQALLSQEWRQPLELEDKYHFLTKVFGGFIAGSAFAENFQSICQRLRRAFKEHSGG